MGKKGKKLRTQKVEDLPPLTPPSGSPRSPTKNQLFAMISKLEGNIEELKRNHEGKITKLERNIEELKAKQEELKANHEQFKVLEHHWSRIDLILCAAEILKWSVNLREANGSDGRQFFQNDLLMHVVVGSKVMGLSLREYQELSRRCINLRNSTPYLATIEALEVVVAHSAHAIKIFPDFWTQLPD